MPKAVEHFIYNVQQLLRKQHELQSEQAGKIKRKLILRGFFLQLNPLVLFIHPQNGRKSELYQNPGNKSNMPSE